MNNFELGYAMGLLVGEGAFTHDGHQPACSVKLHARDPLPLHTLAAAFGGTCHGPYTSRGRNYRVWHLRGYALRRALPTIERYLPPSHKREQFLAWRRKHFEFLQLSPYEFRVPPQ